jgi:hypothetical protein
LHCIDLIELVKANFYGDFRFKLGKLWSFGDGGWNSFKYLFFETQHEAELSMKSVCDPSGCNAIKNSAGGVPEGKPTILAASMCNEGLVSQ